MFPSIFFISNILILEATVVSSPGQRSFYGFTGGGQYSVLTRNKYSSSFQKIYRPTSAVSYINHHSRIYQPHRRPLYYTPPHYQPHYQPPYQPPYHRYYGPAYYHYQPYSQHHYYAWRNLHSGRKTTTERITTTTENSKIKRKKKNFNVNTTSSKSIVSESHSVTMSTTSVVTSISSTISIKQLSTTTSSLMTTNSTVGEVTDLTTEGVFLVYPAVDDTGIDDGLTESPPPETTPTVTTLKPLSLTKRYRENRNIFGLLSQLNQTVSSLCRYSMVKRICTMRNIVYKRL